MAITLQHLSLMAHPLHLQPNLPLAIIIFHLELGVSSFHNCGEKKTINAMLIGSRNQMASTKIFCLLFSLAYF